jgi:ADP-ribose pyrophosphatase YjhB (NUDIX family)
MESSSCIQCGNQLSLRIIDKCGRLVCTKCGHIYSESLRMSVGLWIENNDRVLLVQRASAKSPGRWSLPAKQVEMGETIENAASRVASEIISVEVTIQELFGVFSYHDGFQCNCISIIYHAEISSGVPGAKELISQVAYFDADTICEPSEHRL